jgi:hypothetical protein
MDFQIQTEMLSKFLVLIFWENAVQHMCYFEFIKISAIREGVNRKNCEKSGIVVFHAWFIGVGGSGPKRSPEVWNHCT